MNTDDLVGELEQLAPAGYYVALRLGFAFPQKEMISLPEEWVDHYSANGFLLRDPAVRWAYTNHGAIRWKEIDTGDRTIFDRASDFGLKFGTVAAVDDAPKSFVYGVRADREHTDTEVERMYEIITLLHDWSAPPENLTPAELEALGMVKDGMRLKQIAHELGVTEGAVKQRLKNAKTKLRAQTSAQAAAKAATYGIL